MELVCPFCGFSKETPEQTIPEQAKWAICPRCKQKFEISLPGREGGSAPSEMERDERQAGRDQGSGSAGWKRGGAPWERRSENGFGRGIWQTLVAVLFSPGIFFRRLSVSGGMGEPLAFGLLVGSVGNMLGLFWPVLLISGGFSPFGGSLLTGLGSGWIFLILAVIIPIGVTVGMFLYSAVFHLLLLIVRGGKSGFEATFRVVAYSQAAQVWELVPVIGSWIGSVWRLVIWVVGLREIHNVSYSRVIVAFLLPAALLTILLLAVVIPFLWLLIQ